MNMKTFIAAAAATIVIAIGANIAITGFSDARDGGRCDDKDYYADHSRWCDISMAGVQAVTPTHRYHTRPAHVIDGGQQITVLRDTQGGGNESGGEANRFIVTQTAADVAASRRLDAVQTGWLPSVADFYSKHPGATAIASHTPSHRVRVAHTTPPTTQNINLRISAANR